MRLQLVAVLMVLLEAEGENREEDLALKAKKEAASSTKKAPQAEVEVEVEKVAVEAEKVAEEERSKVDENNARPTCYLLNSLLKLLSVAQMGLKRRRTRVFAPILSPRVFMPIRQIIVRSALFSSC